MKKNMRRLCVPKEHRYAAPSTLCYLCEYCFTVTLDEWEVSM